MERAIYEINVLQKMIKATISVDLQPSFDAQLRRVLQAMYEENLILKATLEDFQLEVKAMSFDLSATKNERDALTEKLKKYEN